MYDQCPKCYSYTIAKSKPGNIFIWISVSLVVSAAFMIVVFSGAVENVIPWIVGFMLLDLLITIPLMAALRSRSQYGGATYRCRECGHTWSETQTFSQEGSTGSAVDDVKMSPSMASPMGASLRGASSTGFRMTVQDVFSIKGRGTVVTGTVESGTITEGAPIEIHGSSGVTQTVAQSIEMFRRTTSQANVGDNVGILLRGIQGDQVQRGDVLQGVR